MRNLVVQTKNGKRNEIVYNINDYPYSDIAYNTPTMRGRGKNNITYYAVSASFDIETTTIEPPYTIGKGGKKKYEVNPYGFMYHWQFCIGDKVVFGRTWTEFKRFINNIVYYFMLCSNRRLVVYVHNLAFEFQFFKDFFEFVSIFAKDKRKPLKAITTTGIEFRCSYMLSNMSLQKFCENSSLCEHYKMVDTYDYRKLRTPKTPMTDEELGYCYNDVRGLCECIDTLLLEDTIGTIPLTNTGYVRRDFRSAMKKNPKNWELLQNTRLTPHLYKLLRKMFRGGNTHASRYFSNTILSNMESFDLQSSYPAWMVLGKYPMGRFIQVENIMQNQFDKYRKKDACIIGILFHNVQVHDDVAMPYIDTAHCDNICKLKADNGRVLRAESFTMIVSELDFEIIEKTYDFDYEITEFWHTHKGKLPVEFREKLMEWYDKKTQLKDVDGQEYEYLKSKNRVNSGFGMMVTDIAHSTVTYSPADGWGEEKPDLEKALDQFYKSQNSFLPYQWGVWVTINARYALQEAIDLLGLDNIYDDTDSVKFINPEKYHAQFDAINQRVIKMCEESDVRAYSVKDGKKYYLGIWDFDGKYKRFKTLGAKKYCYEQYNKEGKLVFKITVSGMNKKKGAQRVGCIENFNIGTTYEDIGRTTSWFNDEPIHTITVMENGEPVEIETASNIGILDTTYTLGVTKEYWEVILDGMDYRKKNDLLKEIY